MGFGGSVALSDDGNILAVGARADNSGEADIGGSALVIADVGGVYSFERDAQNTWSKQAHIHASNPHEDDDFGREVALSGDASTLAVSAPFEGGSATGISNEPLDQSAHNAGAVYLY
jgi:hypothetical protein